MGDISKLGQNDQALRSQGLSNEQANGVGENGTKRSAGVCKSASTAFADMFSPGSTKAAPGAPENRGRAAALDALKPGAGTQFLKAAGSENEGSRDLALRMTKDCPKHSVGAAIYPILKGVMPWVGNMCSGDVGDFYKANQELLCSPATKKNIEEWARKETAYFESAGGCAGFVGGLLSAEQRADMIMKEAREQGAPVQ